MSALSLRRALGPLVLAACWIAPAAPEPASLFEAGTGRSDSATGVGDGAGGGRAGAPEAAAGTGGKLGAYRADLDGLRAIRRSVEAGAAPRLLLNLGRGAEFEAVVERSAPTANGFTLSGPLAGDSPGRAVLVVNGGIVLGRVYSRGHTYVIDTAAPGGPQTVERVEPRPLRCEVVDPLGDAPNPPRASPRTARPDGVPKSAKSSPELFAPVQREEAGGGRKTDGRHRIAGSDDAGPASGPAGSKAAGADAPVVDLLVVYPARVRGVEGGYGRMLATIDLDVAAANEAYAASGVDLRVELAAAVEVRYDYVGDELVEENSLLDRNWEQILNHLANGGDGHLDEVHALRDRYAADLVVMHMGGRPTYEVLTRSPRGGMAFAVPRVSAAALEERGFAIARSGSHGGATYLAHEIGHAMGLMHERGDTPGNEPFPYSHGLRYEDPLWGRGEYLYHGRWSGTVMAAHGVGRGPWVFSNPDLRHPDDPDLRLGVAGDGATDDPDGPADAARHLNEVAETVAGVRARADADPCRHTLSGDAGSVPASGGTFRLRVETDPGCAWEARGGDGVSLVSPAFGEGSAEVSYRVDANEYFGRRVELLVAGRLHTRPQAGPRPITPYRERSEAVLWDLCTEHPAPYEVKTRGGIWRCDELVWDAEAYASMRVLSTLGSISEDAGESDRLHAGDFDGLTGVWYARFRNYDRIPAGLFAGMNSLRFIEVDKNKFDREKVHLAAIEPGAFLGAPGVARIQIGGHRIRDFRAGTFEGMPNLVWLGMWADHGAPAGGRSVRIEPGTFRGLSGLKVLDMGSPEMPRLDAGSFDGLRALRVLDLDYAGLETLEPGVFRGLGQLRDLDLGPNRIRTLPPGVFDGLSRIQSLYLSRNPLSKLPPRLFEDMENLSYLHMSETSLASLESAHFAGLSGLETLAMYDNRLRNLPPGVFRHLGSLRKLFMSQNPVGALRAGVFEGLGRLKTLRLGEGNLTAIEPGVLDGLSQLEILDLESNRLWDIPKGAFRGKWLIGLRLKGNPGAPFRFAPTPVALPSGDAAAGTPLEIAVEVGMGAPFWIGAQLSAEGGRVTERKARIYEGGERSRPTKVIPNGDGPVTVRVAKVEWNGTITDTPLEPDGRDTGGVIVINVDIGLGYTGFRVVPGEPLVLYGFPDLDLEPGGGVETFELGPVFSYFLGPSAEYAAESSDPAVASARVADGVLTVNPRASGAATVTVTATGPGGETRSRSFEVRSRAPSAPLFPPAADPEREGFVRVLNRSGRAGLVRVVAVDDAGNRREAGRLRLRPRGAVHFNSGHLERGDESRGLEGVGAGRGDWRLEFATGLDIAALAYVRTADGFLTAMHDTAAADAAAGGENAVRLPTFNPADNDRQASALRVVNPGLRDAEVSVSGVDDAGASPGGPVRFSVPAGASRSYTSAQLESGVAEGLAGALGDGAGKWRLAVSSSSPVEAMSLLESAGTGHLTNLSSPPVPRGADGVRHVPLFPPAREGPGREGFARVVNRSPRAGGVFIVAYDDAGERRGPLELALGAGEARHFNSADLELGNAAKGLSGSAGAGEGNWRLELTSGLDIDVLAYVRTEDGFLTAVHDSAPFVDGRADLAILNPGSNANQVGVLRLVNPHDRDLRVMVVGTDDAGRAPEEKGAVRVRVPARGALNLTAADLEAGVPSEPSSSETYLSWKINALGDGAGKWRLAVTAELPVLAMSLVENARTGHLTNLSTSPGGVAR